MCHLLRPGGRKGENKLRPSKGRPREGAKKVKRLPIGFGLRTIGIVGQGLRSWEWKSEKGIEKRFLILLSFGPSLFRSA